MEIPYANRAQPANSMILLVTINVVFVTQAHIPMQMHCHVQIVLEENIKKRRNRLLVKVVHLENIH